MALNDSPAGLLSWIVEKFRTWSDCDGDPENVFTRDQLITNVMLYWVTQTITSSARLYWETMHSGVLQEAPEFVSVPTGVARYPEGGGAALPAHVGRAALQRHALGGACRAAATSPPWSSPSCSSTTCAPSSEPCAESRIASAWQRERSRPIVDGARVSARGRRVRVESQLDAARRRSRADRRAVDEYVAHPGRLLGGQPLAVGREVAHAAHRARADRLPDRTRTRRPSSPRAGSRGATNPNMSAGSPLSLRTARSSGMTPRSRTQLPEQVGGQRRVAQLADVRAGVGEAQRHLLVGEQVAHRRGVVVGDVDAEPRLEVLGERELAHHVERTAAALARELVDPPALQLGEPLGLGDLARLPARLHRRLLEVGGRARPPGGIAVRGDARASRSPSMSSPKTSPTFRLNGLSIVNCMVSGRGVTCGQTCAPAGHGLLVQLRAAGGACRRRARTAGSVNGRPMRACRSYMSA